MERNLSNQTLALAAILQALRQVQSLAHEGRSDPDVLATAVHSIFARDPEDVATVFGGLEAVRGGLALVHSQLQSASKPLDKERLRYLVTLLHLERKLARRRDLLDRIGQGIDRARQQAEHFQPTHESVLGSLADTYSQTVSTLRPRVLVAGEPVYLENSATADKVRTFLLAAIRSAVLWRQAGGSRTRL
ncbi:MAG TPA: high frequency lysogenization protein HflD, partial [Gammaproteobacteria bacterium]|nr:high frequency lysogenization protein HflD [Gammaproteobacteria bacterium]